MNSLIIQYFREGPEFQKVLFLNDLTHLSWAEMIKMAPELPRGWFELTRISVENRIHFTYDFWVDRLPFHTKVHPILSRFFEKLDDIGVVLYCNKDIWTAELVYSLKDNSSFFRGYVPASSPDLEEVKVSLGFSLPRDYLFFTKIHNGFGRRSEMGVLQLEELVATRRRFIDQILKNDRILRSGLASVDPGALCPFYEEYGMGSFQCFYADWYPTSEMGNVFFSAIDYTLSDMSQEEAWMENLAFPTFLEWLSYYLEGISLSS